MGETQGKPVHARNACPHSFQIMAVHACTAPAWIVTVREAADSSRSTAFYSSAFRRSCQHPWPWVLAKAIYGHVYSEAALPEWECRIAGLQKTLNLKFD